MKANRALLISLSALALLLSCTASGAREGSAPPKADAGTQKTQYRDGLAGVDFTGLDAAAKERALDILNDQGCDCGCGMGIAECRVKDKTCPRSPGLASTVVASVKAGKTNDQVVAALKQAAPAGAQAAADPGKPADISLEGVKFKGNPNAKATLVEYADFQCPYCVRAVPMVNDILKKYPDDVRYAFKQFPLTSIHKFAEPAARAHLAAGRQGKYWEMYDVLFANARALDDASLAKYASDLGLDMTKFANDIKDPSIQQEIDKDVAESQRIGVGGTPTFFMNGYQLPSTDPATIDKLIATAKTGGDVGVPIGEMRAKQIEQQAAMKKAQQEQQAMEATKVWEINLDGSPVRGNTKGAVTIVEFSDYQCPYCAGSEPLVKQVLDAYPGKVKLVYKHFPLVSIHPNARPAALAATEAQAQGKFWEMHDVLFQNYNQLTRENISKFAKQVGLDMSKFEKSMQAEETKGVLDRDMAEAQKVGVRGTPSFFINGRKVMSRDFDTFKRMIDEALKTTG